MTDTPLLWHLKVSSYNEKARWALDYKTVHHRRRAVDPPRHRPIARKLTGDTTFPVLVIDDEPIGDSTRIIAALERRHPDPPLYPADPEARSDALALEEEFDEHLGPNVRLLVIHNLLHDPEAMLATFTPGLSRARRLIARRAFSAIRRAVTDQFEIDKAAVAGAYTKIDEAAARIRPSLEGQDHLVGGAFTVADLTLASLLAPAVAPPQFPYPQPQRDHPALEPLRSALNRTGLLEWTRVMYERHRHRAPPAYPRTEPAAGVPGHPFGQ